MHSVVISECGRTINVENLDDFYNYYVEARFLKSIPSSRDVYYFYTMDIEQQVNIMESEYHFDEKEGERGYSDMHIQEIMDNTMTLEGVEVTLDYLRLFYLDQHGVFRNPPFVQIW